MTCKYYYEILKFYLLLFIVNCDILQLIILKLWNIKKYCFLALKYFLHIFSFVGDCWGLCRQVSFFSARVVCGKILKGRQILILRGCSPTLPDFNSWHYPWFYMNSRSYLKCLQRSRTLPGKLALTPPPSGKNGWLPNHFNNFVVILLY